MTDSDTMPGLELYKRAFRNTENPTIITDTEYRMVDVNDECTDFTGYSREELIGTPPLMLFSNPAVYQKAVNRLENNLPWQGFIESETKQGELIYGRGSAIPLFVGGEKQGYSGIFVDLTERRKFEQTLKVIHRVLRHDLRNEMNLIAGHAEIIEAAATSDELQADAEEIRRIAHRLIRRSDRAQELERILYEGFEQPVQPTELDAVLRAAITDTRERHDDAEFVVNSLPSRAVMANNVLSAVFESLLENAVVHNDGDPRVEVRTHERAEELVVAIADNGPGIPDAKKERIFGREERDALHHGDGFSLHFVDIVTDTFGGYVEVTDNEMGGATFSVHLVLA